MLGRIVFQCTFRWGGAIPKCQRQNYSSFSFDQGQELETKITLHDAEAKTERLKIEEKFDLNFSGKEEKVATQLAAIEAKLDKCRSSMVKVRWVGFVFRSYQH